jgi:preprotein translocase subunit SecG
MLRIALTFVQFFSALAIVGLVMLQRGKGAEAGAGFGAGASGTVFGARGAGTALSRATAIFTAVFMLNSLALAYVGSHHTEQPKTIFDTAAETQQASPSSSTKGLSAPTQRAAPASGSAAPSAGADQGAQHAGAPAPTSAAPRAGSIPAPAPPPGK